MKCFQNVLEVRKALGSPKSPEHHWKRLQCYIGYESNDISRQFTTPTSFQKYIAENKMRHFTCKYGHYVLYYIFWRNAKLSIGFPTDAVIYKHNQGQSTEARGDFFHN